MALSKFLMVVPLLLSIAGFVLAFLALYAGAKPGQMEEFHVIAVRSALFAACTEFD